MQKSGFEGGDSLKSDGGESGEDGELATRGRVNGNSNSNGGVAHVVVEPEIIGERLEMREAIQREIRKQRIRAEIIAEEMARKSILEEEVRNELRMEWEMMSLRSGGGFSLLPPSHNNLYELRSSHGQPVSLEERKKFANDWHCSQSRGLEVPFQRPGDSPRIKRIPTPLSEDSKKEAIILDGFSGRTLCGTKPKSAPLVAASSVELPSDSSKKKLKEEWRCAICEVNVTNEDAFNGHLQGKKHQSKEAALIARKTRGSIGLGVPKKPIVKLSLLAIDPSSIEKKSKTSSPTGLSSQSSFEKNAKRSSITDLTNMKKEDMNGTKLPPDSSNKKHEWGCAVCQISAPNECALKEHFQGKKHHSKVAALATINPSSLKIESKTAKISSRSYLTNMKKEETVNAVKLSSDSSNKKHEEWGCAVCQISAPNECALKEHFQGKKHHSKVAALATINPSSLKIESKTAKISGRNYLTNMKKKEETVNAVKLSSDSSKKKHKEWKCAICQISAPDEHALIQHFHGKKHQSKEASLTAINPIGKLALK